MARLSFADNLKRLFGLHTKTDESFFEELTDTLIEGDIGAKTAFEILEEYIGRFPDKINLDDVSTNVVVHPDVILPDSRKSNAVAEPLNAVGFSSDAAVLYSNLTNVPCHISELARLTGIPIPNLLTAVTELELAEKIGSHSGRRYSLPH